jgi:TrkA domain protein
MERMAGVNEARLPGVGVRYEFRVSDGTRVAVVHHRSGLRELVVYESGDPDTSHALLRLDAEDSHTLAEILGGSSVTQELATLQQDVEGLAIDWLPVMAGTPFAGRTIGDTMARTRTGVSIVAVIRRDAAFPAPGPEFGLVADDTLVVVGTHRGIEDLVVLLRTG